MVSREALEELAHRMLGMANDAETKEADRLLREVRSCLLELINQGVSMDPEPCSTCGIVGCISQECF